MDLKISNKLQKKVVGKNRLRSRMVLKKKSIESIKKVVNGSSVVKPINRWSFLYGPILSIVILLILLARVFQLQVIEGGELYERSENNQLEFVEITPNRGVIFDANGKKLVENIPSYNMFIDLNHFRDSVGYIDDNDLKRLSDELEIIVGNVWNETDEDGEYIYSSLGNKVLEDVNTLTLSGEFYNTNQLLILKGLDNDLIVKFKANFSDIDALVFEDSTKRHYLAHESFSHILGYTGGVSEGDLDRYDYVSSTDNIGKTGVERIYDEILFGTKGNLVRERNATGKIISDNTVLSEPVSGNSLHLTIDNDAQIKMYELLKEGVDKYDATGGAGIIEDIHTGELLVLASYPSYDNNLFVGGIDQNSFKGLLDDPMNPLLNKAISSEAPPGSTFKTIVAASYLEAGIVDRYHQVLSTAGYKFSNGAPFQEYHNHSYGWVDIVDALTVSSNIYFCDVIREWDMNELVPYIESFGIGEYTYIDIPGEGKGRVPSPSNKINLANGANWWLDPIWYPEGDACNSVIGQGISLVTPIQMSNWVSAIANGGDLHTPRVGKEFVDMDGDIQEIVYDDLAGNIISNNSLEVVREGMWGSVNGARKVIIPLSGAQVTVAAKTGTAEFGKLNEDGIYEFTHAWVTGFYPYEDPQYSFTIFLESGGASNNAAQVAREFIDWWVLENAD